MTLEYPNCGLIFIYGMVIRRKNLLLDVGVTFT